MLLVPIILLAPITLITARMIHVLSILHVLKIKYICTNIQLVIDIDPKNGDAIRMEACKCKIIDISI